MAGFYSATLSNSPALLWPALSPPCTLGLADRLVDDDQVMVEALRLADARAALPPAAFAAVKRRMRGEAAAVLGLPEEAQAQAERLVSSEFAEGYAAFREKRPPRF